MLYEVKRKVPPMYMKKNNTKTGSLGRRPVFQRRPLSDRADWQDRKASPHFRIALLTHHNSAARQSGLLPTAALPRKTPLTIREGSHTSRPAHLSMIAFFIGISRNGTMQETT